MLFVFLLFLTMAMVLLSVSLGLKIAESQLRKKVTSMLATLGTTGPARPSPVLADRKTSEPAAELLQIFGLRSPVEALLRRAGVDWPVSQVVLSTLILTAGGALLGSAIPVLVFPGLSIIGLALVFGCLPVLYLRNKGRARLRDFERQFPEALDFLARAMRAGHAFASSLEMLAAESPAPLGPEFRQIYEEQNLGASLDTALRGLAQRIPLVDVQFFVSAVLLQKDVGGNLGEILRNLARVIRERFQLKGQVKAASAHGRVTAMILSILPLLTMLGLFITAPGYLQSMVRDHIGKYLVLTAILGQLLGYYLMKRIVNIKI